MGDPFDGEARRQNFREKLALPVAALVVEELVVLRPHPRVGGHREKKRPSGTEHAADLGERGSVVVEVLDDVERGDDVEGAVPERKPGRVGADEIAEPAACSGEREGLFARVNADDAAEIREEEDVPSGAASEVENFERAAGDRPGKGLAEDLPAAGIPPEERFALG